MPVDAKIADRLAAGEVLYYLHIPKTAGTTFNAVLETYFRPDQVWPFHAQAALVEVVGENLATELARTPPETLSGYRLIRGHYDYTIHRYLPRKPLYVTMLRNPVDRTLSLYGHIRRVASHRLHQEISTGRRGVRDLLEHPLAPRRFNNRQVHQVAGTLHGREPIPDSEALETAKRRLQDEFAFFGISERFDASLSLLFDTFGWRPAEAYQSLNVAPSATKRTVEADELDAIVEHNQLDIELYRFADALFSTRRERLP